MDIRRLYSPQLSFLLFLVCAVSKRSFVYYIYHFSPSPVVLGEVTYGKNGFKAEIRGLMEAYQQQSGKVAQNPGRMERMKGFFYSSALGSAL